MRDSLKRMEFQESLHLRTSNLRLHDMDEVAVSRHSQLSVSLPVQNFAEITFRTDYPLIQALVGVASVQEENQSTDMKRLV